MTKQAWVNDTKKLAEEAWEVDPIYVSEVFERVSGREDGVFVWDHLSVPKLHQLRVALFTVVLSGRGQEAAQTTLDDYVAE